MLFRSELEKPEFFTIDSLISYLSQNADYPVENSCIWNFESSQQSARKHKGMSIEAIFVLEDSTLKLNNNLDNLEIDPFAKHVGITAHTLMAVILAYFAKKPAHILDRGLSHYSISTVYLAYLKYHRCPSLMALHSINFEEKCTAYDQCTICHATMNIIREPFGFVTISPVVFTGNRQPLSMQTHFVVWSSIHSIHDLLFEDDTSIMKVLSFPSSSMIWKTYKPLGIYAHGVFTYGHPHVHVLMTREIHDVRALELMVKCQVAINNDDDIKDSDYYFPMNSFSNSCSNVGRKHIAISFIIRAIRIKLPNIHAIETFYALAYPELLSKAYKIVSAGYSKRPISSTPVLAYCIDL